MRKSTPLVFDEQGRVRKPERRAYPPAKAYVAIGSGSRGVREFDNFIEASLWGGAHVWPAGRVKSIGRNHISVNFNPQ